MGGTFARWRGDSADLYFLAPDGRLMAAIVNGRGTALTDFTAATWDSIVFESSSADPAGSGRAWIFAASRIEAAVIASS